MKIIIDAFQYSNSVTGTDRMAYNFLYWLQKIDTSNEYIVLCSRQRYTRSVIKNPNFTVIKPPAVCAVPVLGRYFAYIWRRVIKLVLLSSRADTYFSFHNMTLPGRRLARRMIASNLDLIPILLKDYSTIGRISVAEQEANYRRVIELSDAFVSISNYSKAELATTLGVSKRKISVIHLAADPAFSMKAPSKTVKSLNLPPRYLFTIGGSEPRKNVQTVIQAYTMLPAKVKEDTKLVIAGGKWHGRELDIVKDQSDIIELGYVHDDQLPGLYQHALAFIFASSYEGFGFTILEAMASDTPVINARGSSLDEVAGRATLTFGPHNAPELADKIEELLGNTKLQSALICKGRAQNQKFSWEKSARQLHSLLIGD